MENMKTLLTTLVLLLALGACGGSTGGTETGTTDSVPQISAALKLASETSPASELVKETKKAVGQAPAAGLLSMKYYITNITICEDMDTEGTAFSNPSGCLELYAGANDENYNYELDDDFAPFGDVARASDTGFVDLIDDTSRDTLTTEKTLTSDNVRSYNYGYITWYLPVKLTAEVDMGDGTFFRTNDGTTVTGEDEDQGPITTATTDFTDVETASEAVVVLGNGGSWFKFQNPFEITQADIDSNTQFALDLTFNPEGLVKGYSADLGGCGGCILKDPSGNQLSVPMIDLTPVPHKSSETVQKETYVASVSTGAANFDLRIETYSIQDDPDGTIYGIDTATLMNADTTTAVNPFPKVAFIGTGDDGNLVLEDYREEDGFLISGFERLTTVGATMDATLHCGDSSTGGFTTDGCEDSETLDVTFTLESISTLD